KLARVHILVCCIVFLASAAFAANMTEKPIVSAGFGTGPDQFGYAGIEASKKTTRLVNCFAADRNHIAVHDRIKKDIKLYNPAGVFQRTIPLVLKGASADTVRARDIALGPELLYVLVDDQPGNAKEIPASMRLAVFDLKTGQCTSVRNIDTSSIVPPGKQPARGADALCLQPNGATVWIFDTIRQMSFEVTGTGIGKKPRYGWGGSRMVRTDDNVGAILLLDGEGKIARRLPESGVVTAVTESGDGFAVMQSAGGADWAMVVYNGSGDKVGVAPRPNRTWKPFKAPVMERKYELADTPTGPELYEMYASASGVRIVRWSK
ncbi:MAG TPA: hypothetical protein VFU38_03690, partial [Candidatus Krumholzibacteria bacterium]|nr:hypothetical protein [Candidatus Krumholzibacteria bacterium]